jgi:DNA-binding HxlR family transcriptional regulator
MPHVPPAKRHPYDQWSPDARALDLVGDKWTLLIVRDLMPGPRRFVELQRVLPGISTEQLRSRLNRMVADGMLTRKRYREVPPRVDYELTERARELAPVLGELARWGYEWTWSAPRPNERVDVRALFRLLPGMINQAGPAGGLRGTVALTVTDGRDGQPVHALLTVTDGSATVSEPEDERHADARLQGSTAEWVRALAAPGDLSGLRRSGAADLLEMTLGLLTLGRASEPALVAGPSEAAAL